MEEVMKEMNYDSKRTPLGNLTTSQIHAGYAALSEIVQLLNSGGKGSALVNACNNFYTKIPHDFGRKTPTIITTLEEIQEKLKMLEALGNINVAMNLMDERMDIDEDPLDKYYKKLKCHLTLLDHSSEEFAIIENCIQTTHGPTHNSYSMTVIDIFSCRRELESASFLNYGNVMLLWHGSRLTNWLGILKEGLQIAPRKELITGSLFGKGIYFADVSSKSANYCKATKKNDEGLLLLCEVSLGQQLCLYENENINLQLPEGYHSVAGIGSIKPSTYHLGVLSTEAKLPGGPLIEENMDCYLKYNEYVVYNPKQVKMR
ncbi:Poly [ADP-ribose] polymerase 2, partial [Stegodyphus mimosarum]